MVVVIFGHEFPLLTWIFIDVVILALSYLMWGVSRSITFIWGILLVWDVLHFFLR